eukprot:1954209-Pyramimonas_sp.AAC.1
MQVRFVHKRTNTRNHHEFNSSGPHVVLHSKLRGQLLHGLLRRSSKDVIRDLRILGQHGVGGLGN